jgi:hypothetical protein
MRPHNGFFAYSALARLSFSARLETDDSVTYRTEPVNIEMRPEID